SQTVEGTVSDAEIGDVLPGVNIQVEGTSVGTTTNTDGEYSIEVEGPGSVLVFSYVGYVTEEITVGDRNVIDVAMASDFAQLDEMVVVGYGSVQKSSLTSSISKIDVENENLAQIPAGRPENALAGRMAGVSIVNARSTPGSAPMIRIRGVGSIDAGNEPLIVIDGYPGGDLGRLNMNDVESIEVLKDASSTAIYGSRGAGGVILVTTKRGVDGAAQISYNSYFGVSSAILHDDWLLGEEWYEYLVKYQNREFAWQGGDTSIPMWGDPKRSSEFQVNPLTYELPQTNWQNEVTQIAPMQNHGLSVRGGIDDNVRYSISGNYMDEEGTLITGHYKQYNVRANLDIDVNDKLDVGFNLNPSVTRRRIPDRNMTSLSKYPPFVPPTHPDIPYHPRTNDFITSGHSGQASPLTYLNGRRNNNETYRNQGQIFATYQPTQNLLVRSSVGADLSFSLTDDFRGTLNDPVLNNGGADLRSRNVNLVNENTLNYTKTFAEVHDINAMVGASYQQSSSHSSALRAESNTYNNEIIKTINNAVVGSNSTSSKSDWGLISYFSRLNYGYNDKYLISAVFRTDGSSRFGANNKWGNFPSLSAAWRMSEEAFLQDVSFIDELKFRGSYGVTGNNNIGNYTYLGTVGTVVYSPGNEHTQGQAQNSFENPDLTWERTTGTDIGVDLSMLSNRVNITLDYYDSKTSDLLYNLNIPAHTGFTSTISNIGEVRNYGFELELMTRNLVGDFNWNTSFNVSRNYNEVLDLGGVDERLNTHSWGMGWILKVGEPMFSYYGYKIESIFQNEEEIANAAHLPQTKPGNPRLEDLNNDGDITPEDKQILGNFQPKALFGMVNEFSWKNFDLSVAASASVGALMYNAETQSYQGNTMGAMRTQVVENQWWSEDEPGDGKTPAAALSQLVAFNANNDYYLENSSYFTIRNLNFGYTLPSAAVERLGLRGIRFYTSVNNLLMITSSENSSYNPEGSTTGGVSGIDSLPGYNGGAEPVNRVFTLGLNLDF
ncbi:MAG: TonB-dependent receptor, partial [Balneolales bacterium]